MVQRFWTFYEWKRRYINSNYYYYYYYYHTKSWSTFDHTHSQQCLVWHADSQRCPVSQQCLVSILPPVVPCIMPDLSGASPPVHYQGSWSVFVVIAVRRRHRHCGEGWGHAGGHAQHVVHLSRYRASERRRAESEVWLDLGLHLVDFGSTTLSQWSAVSRLWTTLSCRYRGGSRI